MKKNVLMILVFLLGMSCGYAQKLSTKEKRALREQEVKEMIDERDFVFQARSATPISGPTVNFSTYYDFSISGMEVESWLPYYGSSDVPSYDLSESMTFREVANVIDVQFVEKKNEFEIKIQLDTDDDSYDILMTIGMGGCGYMVVNPQNKESITYYGSIEKSGSMNAYAD